MSNTEPNQPPRVRPIGPPQSVPVFNCRVIVSRSGSGESFEARAAELQGLAATGATEREALQKLVAAFKRRIAEYHATQEEVPWIKPGDSPTEGEREYFVPVHL